MVGRIHTIRRDVEFVLQEYYFWKEYFFGQSEDPRRWPMDDVVTIENTIGLPANMEEGDYALYLNLPDPATYVIWKPQFFHSDGQSGQLWDDATGYNSLKVSVNVDNDNVVPDYAGADFFAARNVVNASLQPSPLSSSASASKVLLYWGNW